MTVWSAAACVADDLGEVVPAEPPANRIVSLVPSLTELLFAIGAGDRIVGVTRFCEQPAAAVALLPKVGGTKNPDGNQILSLRPDLVIANAEENRHADVACLRTAGVRVFVTYPRRVAAVPALLRKLGRLCGCGARAEEMASELEEELAGQPPPVRRRVFCPIWKNPWMSMNADTYAHDLLDHCGGENICGSQQQRYPVVSLEEIAAFDPEVVLLPDEPYRFSRRDRAELAPLSGTTALRSGAVYFIDGKALTWFGARTRFALRYLRLFFHPHRG